MCLSIPARVLAIDGKNAEVDVYGDRRQVFVACDNLRVDDWVLLYGGVALCILEDAAAAEMIHLLNQPTGA